MNRSHLLILLAVFALIGALLGTVLLTGGFKQFTAQDKLHRVLLAEAMQYLHAVEGYTTREPESLGCGIYLIPLGAEESIRNAIRAKGFTERVDLNPPIDGCPESVISGDTLPGWVDFQALHRIAAKGDLERWIVTNRSGEYFVVEFYSYENAMAVLLMDEEQESMGRRIDFSPPEGNPADWGPAIPIN